MKKCFYESGPTRRGYLERNTYFWDHRPETKTLSQRDGEKSQEADGIPVIEERVLIENDPLEPGETEIQSSVETEITSEELHIINRLKVVMKRDWTEEYLPFKKVHQR